MGNNGRLLDLVVEFLTVLGSLFDPVKIECYLRLLCA